MLNVEIPNIYKEIPGGPELLRWFGMVPSFHDSEIISFDLRRAGPSKLCVHGFVWAGELGKTGYKHAVVTFVIEDIMDLQLDGFSHQNVIGCLNLQRATDRGRASYYSHPQSPEDIEIVLEPCFGLDGVIRAKCVSILFEPGLPDGPSVYRDDY